MNNLIPLKITHFKEECENGKEVETLYYECPCGKGEITEERKKQFGADFYAISILCAECEKRYGVKFDKTNEVRWDLYEREL